MLKSLSLTFSLLAGVAMANPDPAQVVRDVVLPGFETLAERSHALDAAAAQDCAPDSVALRDAWAEAFDAWVRVSHLRFGPTEVDDRAFALAFWPDSRGVTPRTLAGLIADEDPVVTNPEAFQEVSIAARGFYALEFLLYDPAYADGSDYTCQLVQAVARDTSDIADAILADWQDFVVEFTDEGSRYQTREEALQELFKAVTAGLQFTSDTRIGRPMGSFDRPRPARAEARRSERSLRHVRLSLEGTEALALALAAEAPEVAKNIQDAYADAFAEVEAQDSPTFANVDTPMGRFKVEVLQGAVDSVRTVIGLELGPELGVVEGFNALDGD
ncbi:hypothetical protein GGQ68_002895 [Sagittula marina]|uniref:Imelysin-like domain-containing protein n=1 Tax=Sagittula marina TaxID=943940 RepID=A0A7W6GT76_9RHOB|nr:imelysin family protein [Sagittula marina]MBB3986552.1 hypothetical protein [Sagittula marina]